MANDDGQWMDGWMHGCGWVGVGVGRKEGRQKEKRRSKSGEEKKREIQ